LHSFPTRRSSDLLGKDARSHLLGEVEIVLVQRVLGVVTATDQASSAKHASRPGGALAAEIRVRDQLPRFAEKYGDFSALESLTPADLLSAFLQHAVRFCEPGIRGRS